EGIRDPDATGDRPDRHGGYKERDDVADVDNQFGVLEPQVLRTSDGVGRGPVSQERHPPGGLAMHPRQRVAESQVEVSGEQRDPRQRRECDETRRDATLPPRGSEGGGGGGGADLVGTR